MITLTPNAAEKVAELIKSEPDNNDLVLRVAVKPGGCSGFTYEMYFDSEVSDDDAVDTFGDVRVAVDPASAPHVEGASVDYRDGLTGAGFHISNPNAQRSCGCGNSFS